MSHPKPERRTPSDTKQQPKPNKPKHWADMTPAEKARVLATIRPPGVRE